MAITYSYIGKGTIYIGPQDRSSGMLPMGNCSSLELQVTEDKKEQQDYTTGGGGLANSQARISGVTANITALELSPDNIARALRGDVTSQTADTVSSESQTAYHGGLVDLDFLPDTAETITVKDSSDTTTYVKGTDYTVTRAGIIILSGGSITDGESILVSYTKALGDVVEALTNSGIEYRLVFNGLNEASSDSPVVVKLHRVKFSPTSGMSLIGDEFAELPMTADVLSDPNMVGAGISKYAQITLV